MEITKVSEVIFDNGRSTIRVDVEKDTGIVSLVSTLSGYSDTTIFMYMDEFEKSVKVARKLMKQETESQFE